MNNAVKSTFFLFVTAIIWGSAFVAQRAGMEDIGPFYFSALRMLIGAGALYILILITDRINKKKRSSGKDPGNSSVASSGSLQDREDRKTLWKGGVYCGIIIFFASNFQQVGLVSVDAGKTGFITALYIILVPLLGIFLKHRISLFNWIGAVLGVIGLYFLCITDDFSILPGDLIVLIGAFFWAFHILCIDHYAPKVDPIKLTAIQFLLAGIVSLVVAFFTETISMSILSNAAFSILYTGIFSTAIAFSCQTLGQKYSDNPTAASIILSTEALFAVIFGFLLLGETLTFRESLGCVLMFCAVIIAQIPARSKEKTI